MNKGIRWVVVRFPQWMEDEPWVVYFSKLERRAREHARQLNHRGMYGYDYVVFPVAWNVAKREEGE